MPELDGTTYPTISPYLYYEDGNKAADWLIEVFGLTERMREVDDDGTVRHCELGIGDGVVMLGSPPGHRSTASVGHVAGGLWVLIDDVDAHFERAKAAGAEIQEPPSDQAYGVRSYGVLDLEGNQWWFAQPLGR